MEDEYSWEGIRLGDSVTLFLSLQNKLRASESLSHRSEIYLSKNQSPYIFILQNIFYIYLVRIL
jgi:hypothetical protein